jgi:X-Pro dipeptidyl-peptidase
MRRVALLVTVVILGGLLTPMTPAAAATVTEVLHVPTVGGEMARVEVVRDPKFDPQPIILSLSPYNDTGSAFVADDSMASYYNPKGYARAVGDVLGTRGSTGCWDYGGAKEQQAGVDVVNFLGKLPWSNGNVGMTGVSYDGTTANMVAARGDDVPALKAIVPIAAISRWYGYAFNSGVRYFLNSRVPTDEGIDTPILFDLMDGRGVIADPEDPYFAEIAQDRAGECGIVSHTQQGYSRSPDYGPFWQERDYRKDAAKFRAAVFLVHGWQDYNVKQVEGLALYDALPVDDPATPERDGVPFKKLWLTQSSHAGGSGAGYQQALDRFWARTLKGTDNGIESDPPVRTLGRTSAGAAASARNEASWPPAGTQTLSLHMDREFNTLPGSPAPHSFWDSTGEYGALVLDAPKEGIGWGMGSAVATSEEVTTKDPMNRVITEQGGQKVQGHGYVSLYHESKPLTAPLRIAGAAELDTWVNPITPGEHLTPVLVEVLPDGTMNVVERGFLNLDYRDGLATAKPATGWQHAVVRFLPQDYTFSAGSRVGLLLQSTNTVWAVPGNPGFISIADGPIAGVAGSTGTTLRLPVVDLGDASTRFAK